MGLNTNRESGTYITILNGKFCQRVDSTTEGAIARVNKLGNTVYEKFYDSFTAKLVGIKTQDSQAYGKNWVFSFRDEGSTYHLQLSFSNSFATAFLKMLPNINLENEMKIQPSTKEVDGKTKSSLFVTQNGVNVKHAYTMENPNGLPPMRQITLKGQLVWDDTDRIEFLYNMVNTTIIPKLPKNEQKQESEQKSDSALSLDSIPTEQEAIQEEQPF